jgi:heptosyltransferase-2
MATATRATVMTDRPKILIIAPSWVGDAVLSQPLLHRLQERTPAAVIEVLAPPWTRAVFERMPEVAAVHDLPFAHGELALRKRWTLARKLAQRGYTRAVVLPNSLKSALIPFFARIPQRSGYVGEARWCLLNDARRLDRAALPLMIERFAALAEDAGAPPQRPLAAVGLVTDNRSRDAALARLGLSMSAKIAVLCAGAEYGPAKRWPVEYFGELAQRFKAAGWQVWLAGSPKDAAAGAEIVAASAGSAVNLCGKTTLAEAIDLIACASHVVSNDSGLMHVAAALGRPLTALYGSSSPAFTPPPSALARVIKIDIACSPCFKRACPLGHFNCMRRLTPDAVWQEVSGATMAGS